MFVCLISVKTIFSNVWSSLIYFGATWFFQIIHSAMTGTKPPISFKYILCVSIGKLFPAVKIKLKYFKDKALCFIFFNFIQEKIILLYS